jgi:hypothetical protein
MAELSQQIITRVPMKQTNYVHFMLDNFNLIYTTDKRIVYGKEKERYIFRAESGKSFECDKPLATILINSVQRDQDFIRKHSLNTIIYRVENKGFHLETALQDTKSLFNRAIIYIKNLFKQEK